MDIHVPSVPPHLVLTRTMAEDFVLNPLLLCRVSFPEVRLAPFQRAALKLKWIIPFFEDCSGQGSGKTANNWLFAQSRAMVIVNGGIGQVVSVYFPYFDTAKRSFWCYYTDPLYSSPFFRAQLGKRHEKDTEDETQTRTKGPSNYVQYFRNGSEVNVPAASLNKGAATQKGTGCHTLIIEEVSEWDKQGNAIDEELVGRCRREAWNPDHPIWGNHIVYSYHAEKQSHPAWKRHREYAAQVRRGNPLYGVYSWSYKDLTSRPRTDTSLFGRLRSSAERVLTHGGRTLAEPDRLGRHFGIWARDGGAWYAPLIEPAVERGRALGLVPVLSARMMANEVDRILGEAYDRMSRAERGQ